MITYGHCRIFTWLYIKHFLNFNITFCFNVCFSRSTRWTNLLAELDMINIRIVKNPVAVRQLPSQRLSILIFNRGSRNWRSKFSTSDGGVVLDQQRAKLPKPPANRAPHMIHRKQASFCPLPLDRCLRRRIQKLLYKLSVCSLQISWMAKGNSRYRLWKKVERETGVANYWFGFPYMEGVKTTP